MFSVCNHTNDCTGLICNGTWGTGAAGLPMNVSCNADYFWDLKSYDYHFLAIHGRANAQFIANVTIYID